MGSGWEYKNLFVVSEGKSQSSARRIERGIGFVGLFAGIMVRSVKEVHSDTCRICVPRILGRVNETESNYDGIQCTWTVTAVIASKMCEILLIFVCLKLINSQTQELKLQLSY